MKAKFTTNINKNLLQKIKIKAIEENKNVNEIIEKQLEKYLKEEKTMLKLIVKDHGEEEILKEGTLKEVVKYLKENEELTNWVLDEEPDMELPNLERIETTKDLQFELDKIDLSWWTLEIIEKTQKVEEKERR